MGIQGYFKASKAKNDTKTDIKQPQVSERPLRTRGPPQNPTELPHDFVPPRASFRNSSDGRSLSSTRSSFFDDIKHEVMVNYLHQQQCTHLWFGGGSGQHEGVMLRKARNDYLSCPPRLVESVFGHACAELNVQAAMTVNSRVIRTFLAWSPDAIDVPLMNGLRVQILPTIEDLTRARKHQFAAFVASEALLVVWDDDASNLITRAKAIESELMQFVWQTVENGEEPFDEKGVHISEQEIDTETGEPLLESRPTNLMNTMLVACTLIIVVTLLGLGCRSVAIEVAVDHGYLRLAFLALIPVQIFFTLVCFTALSDSPILMFSSSSRKSSLAVLHNASALSDRCSSTRNTTQPSVLHVSATKLSPISQYNVQSTRKASFPSSHPQSSPSSKPSQHTSSKVGLPTCSSTMTAYNSSLKMNDKPASNSTKTIALAGLLDRNTAQKDLSERANSRKHQT